MALDVQAQDVLCMSKCVIGGGGVLHTTGLATSTNLDLSLDHHRLADFFGDRLGILGGGGNPARRRRHVVLSEQLLGLVLE
ncbi:Uncharacterised protein [Mycobacteroides abscessus subsp. massiliense]|nr:Uncharacterised protein [Mycobacteroides abscessus subsp. massiliense]